MKTDEKNRMAAPATRAEEKKPNPAVPMCPAAVTGEVSKVNKLQTFVNPEAPMPTPGPLRGVLCPSPNCKSRRIKVNRTVTDKPGMIIRYRQCEDCGRNFSTEEKVR